MYKIYIKLSPLLLSVFEHRVNLGAIAQAADSPSSVSV